eukprot:759001-Hanusia_phi.AAC.1
MRIGESEILMRSGAKGGRELQAGRRSEAFDSEMSIDGESSKATLGSISDDVLSDPCEKQDGESHGPGSLENSHNKPKTKKKQKQKQRQDKDEAFRTLLANQGAVQTCSDVCSAEDKQAVSESENSVLHKKMSKHEILQQEKQRKERNRALQEERERKKQEEEETRMKTAKSRMDCANGLDGCDQQGKDPEDQTGKNESRDEVESKGIDGQVKNNSPLRCPIICILGHLNTGRVILLIFPCSALERAMMFLTCNNLSEAQC